MYQQNISILQIIFNETIDVLILKLWRLIVIRFTHFVDQIGSVYSMTYKRSILVRQIKSTGANKRAGIKTE